MTVDTERFRKRLLDERGRVQDAIEHVQSENAGTGDEEDEEPAGDNHPADVATFTHDREVDETLEQNSSAVLAAIDHALTKLDDGSYGICEECGREIGEERLDARPWARLCIDDQRKQERG